LSGAIGACETCDGGFPSPLRSPDRGHARVAGIDGVADRRRARGPHRLTGHIVAVDAKQTGEENLRPLARLGGLARAAAQRRAADLLDRFGLADAGHRLAATYS
ncbi:ABC transporter, partial [Streptomyces sp. JV176]|nr:ABC transporter [Streptomyces sp. JV176]